MRGFRRGRVAAAAGFLLVASVVLGGMSWATLATLELQKRTVEDEHRTRMSKAVWRMDSYMGGILDGEMHRPFTDYFPFYTDVPLAAWSTKPADVDVDYVLLTSKLLESGPPHKWIDFYFQVDEDGNWSSPEHPSHSAPWIIPESAHARSLKVCDSLAWLEEALPVADLIERVAEARERDEIGDEITTPPRPSRAEIGRRHDEALSSVQVERHKEYLQRGLTKLASQLRSRAQQQCVNPSHSEDDIADIVSIDHVQDDHAHLATVGVYGEHLATFWIQGAPTPHSKLAFVRTAYKDAKIFHQGFISDWQTLKDDLLRKAAPILADADLQPAPDNVPPDPELSDITLNTIPARLRIPDLDPADTAALAWMNVRGMLLASWSVAGAVLVVAGIGFRNLIALTERRMQFAYAVTHELRTPLTTFRLYADMLSGGLVPEESKQEYVETLNRESVRLAGLVEGVLEYARLENHKVRLNARDTNAEALLASVSETLRKRCGEYGIEPRTDNAMTNGLAVRTDVDVVNQIAGVLINNACRHTAEAENPLVLVKLMYDDGKIHLDVIDSGPGIHHRDARRIFKPFRRGRGADATAQGGIGLGLALARSWANLLGGNLHLVARRHRQYGGAHFRLTIPAQVRSTLA